MGKKGGVPAAVAVSARRGRGVTRRRGRRVRGGGAGELRPQQSCGRHSPAPPPPGAVAHGAVHGSGSCLSAAGRRYPRARARGGGPPPPQLARVASAAQRRRRGRRASDGRAGELRPANRKCGCHSLTPQPPGAVAHGGVQRQRKLPFRCRKTVPQGAGTEIPPPPQTVRAAGAARRGAGPARGRRRDRKATPLRAPLSGTAATRRRRTRIGLVAADVSFPLPGDGARGRGYQVEKQSRRHEQRPVTPYAGGVGGGRRASRQRQQPRPRRPPTRR